MHRLVLSACSDYFEQMFAITIGKHCVIVLKDISKEVFETLLKYMYFGEVEVKKELLSAVIDAAHSLSIKGLVDANSGKACKSEKASSNSDRNNLEISGKRSHDTDSFSEVTKKHKLLETSMCSTANYSETDTYMTDTSQSSHVMEHTEVSHVTEHTRW